MNPDYKLGYHKEGIDVNDYSYFVLAGDIGGTNTNLGICGVKDEIPVLLFSLLFKTQELSSVIPAVNKTLEYAKDKHGIEINDACFGAAGAVSSNHDFCRLTNAEWGVSSKEILEKTPIESVFIINDFEAIGYGVNLLDVNNEKDIFNIKHKSDRQKELLKETKAIIGAGTGFGKSILVYEKDCDAYVPVQSEGGHGDFPAQNEFEIKLLEFIKQCREIKKPVSYEEVLSGRGIEAIYLFLINSKKFKTTKYTKEISESGCKSPLISKYKNADETCRETFLLYAKFYGRCAKNFVLDTLARGGLYIAGGIASQNKEIFKKKEFMDEFENVNKQSEILKEVPVYVVVNYNVSLYGAAFAAVKRHTG
jgi:glucokinase